MAGTKKKTGLSLYEVNDVFGWIGYSLVTFSLVNYFDFLEVAVIPVDNLWDLIKGLFNTDAAGNIVSTLIGLFAVVVEKYVRYGRIW